MNEFSKFIEDKTMRAKKKFEIEKNGNEEIETEIATHTHTHTLIVKENIIVAKEKGKNEFEKK
mgnify:CR=1 FL=1